LKGPHGEDLNVYGTSLPDEVRTPALLTLAYYMYRKQIKKIVSLQACAMPNRPINNQDCPPKIDQENELWNTLKFNALNIDFPVQPPDPTNSIDPLYLPLEDCPMSDMTPGTLSVWLNSISKKIISEYIDNSQTWLVHCLAGFGRTGSVLCYSQLTRYSIFTNSPTGGRTAWSIYNTPWLGSGSSLGMMKFLKAQLEVGTRLFYFSDTSIASVNLEIGNFDIGRIPKEVFNIDDVFHASIFIGRVNLYILSLAYRNQYPLSTIILYRVPRAWNKPIPAFFNETNILDCFDVVNIATKADINSLATIGSQHNGHKIMEFHNAYGLWDY
jgi:hypothetical protein